ncbi:MAG: hypothetical protein DVS81_04670 [Candidatus Accumulibacter meliphilus]|uniref:Uncharacterized protein n=1 Tax=Candidatus Accumulibacter meliphilus TaxID=2211374 RepID=A0A369XWC4_9PROT|nr:MAG: hypothetical protein DVS81_04670 [Candidatus Accumulibacter meliphilus]
MSADAGSGIQPAGSFEPVHRSPGTALECQQAFFGSLEALTGIPCDRFAEDCSWPGLCTGKLRQRR